MQSETMAVDWPAPPNVATRVTTVLCGNLATHVGDRHEALANRQKLVASLHLPEEPLWLNQSHGNKVADAEREYVEPPVADAAYTRLSGKPLAVMVADCVPILVASRSGEEIAVIHAGWRGLASGVIGEAIDRFSSDELIAWIGPHIGPCHYEVDAAVRGQFDARTGFLKGRDEHHWMMDLSMIAGERLRRAGVHEVSVAGACTFCDERFYSHRREPDVGRFAALVWRLD